MGNPLYSPVNHLARGTLSLRTSAASHPSFPLAHLADLKAGTLWRRAGTGSFNVYVDFPGIVGADTVALINHNLLPGTNVRLFSYEPVGYYLEIANLSALLDRPKFVVRFPRKSVRGYMLSVQNVAQADPPSIGQWWLGDGFELTRNVAWGVSQGTDYRSSDLVGHTGKVTSYHIGESDFFDGTMGTLDPAEAEEMRLLYERVKGKAGRFLFMPDSSSPEAFIGRLEDGRYQARNVSVNRFDGMSLRVAEDPWGRPGV